MASRVETEQKWLSQWESARVALAEQRKRELRALSDIAALASSEALLSLAATIPLDHFRRNHSGLVEQQALFHRRPGK